MKFKKHLFILFIAMIPLFGISLNMPQTLMAGNDENFDSTAIKGYHFFLSKGIHFDSTSNIKLYNEVYTWFGVPYRYGGRSKAGTDCSGFATQIYKIVYNKIISGSANDIYQKLKHIEKSGLKEGDLVFFKINRYRISHVGIYLSNNKFIHATSWGKSVTISDLKETYYSRYYFSAGRIEEKTE